MTPEPTPADPVRYGSRYGSSDGPAADAPRERACPICQTAALPSRARYCSDACKQRAYRLRRAVVMPIDRARLAAEPRRRQALVAHTVYECPTCETRLLGTQRCPDCHVFCRRLGLGGLCSHCDEPVLLADILPPEVLP
jgi:hypothetical protein